MASSLPTELVMEIMSRVQAKTVVRSRAVSKQFRSLLSDPYFLGLHHNRSHDSLLTLKRVYNVRVFSSDYRKIQRTRCDFSVTNKANGLVEIFTLDFDSPLMTMLSSYHQLLCFVCKKNIYLCNPVTKESKKLPLSISCFNRSKECLVSFGFVNATKQYKVIKWPHDLEENRTRRLPSGLITTWKKVDLVFNVLNIDIVEDGRVRVSHWRRVQRPCPYLLQLSSQVHVNGFIYWTTSDFQIVSFSLQDESFSTLDPKPPCLHLDTQGSKEKRIFSLSGNSGNLWVMDYNVSSKILEICKMEENGWGKIHKMNIQELHLHPRDDIGSHQLLFKVYPWLWICYDAKTNTLKNCKRVAIECHSTDGLLTLHNVY